jgi:hypothetical protein
MPTFGPGKLGVDWWVKISMNFIVRIKIKSRSTLASLPSKKLQKGALVTNLIAMSPLQKSKKLYHSVAIQLVSLSSIRVNLSP